MMSRWRASLLDILDGFDFAFYVCSFLHLFGFCTEFGSVLFSYFFLSFRFISVFRSSHSRILDAYKDTLIWVLYQGCTIVFLSQ